MHKFLMRAVLGLSVVAGGVAVARPAHAMKLVNLSTGFCLGTAAGAISNGTPIIVWACDGSANQQWNKGNPYSPGLSKEPTYFQHNNGAQTSSCLGVAAASKSDGAPLVLWSCVAPGPDQFWEPVRDASTACYVFRDKNSGLVMGVSAGSIQQGAKTIQWDDLHHTGTSRSGMVRAIALRQTFACSDVLFQCRRSAAGGRLRPRLVGTGQAARAAAAAGYLG